jgi:hypothetical protein
MGSVYKFRNHIELRIVHLKNFLTFYGILNIRLAVEVSPLPDLG